MNSTKKYKIAIVHDDFIQKGGAEFLILDIAKNLNLSEEFEIKIFSSLISPEWKNTFNRCSLNFEESFLKNIPFSYKISKFYIFFELFNLAFNSFDFDSFDVVFSSSTRYAHNLITKPNVLHISYINSPARFIWFTGFSYPLQKLFLTRALPWFKRVDKRSQNLADIIIANSKNIKNKIRDLYDLNSIILNPFTDIEIPLNPKTGNYYVLISRLTKWKKIDYVIDAFNEMGLNLLIIGTGEQLKQLKSKSLKNISFLGFVSEDDKKKYLSEAKALIFPQNEDFGLTLVESLRAGTPIIYFNAGGAEELLNKNLGTSFEVQDKYSLINAIKNFSSQKFDSKDLVEKSMDYTSTKFISFLKKLIITQIKMKKRIN